MKKPTIIILAGGEGKNFKPFVTCKTLFSFFGKPILQHTLEQLEKNGFENILISTNENNDQWLKNYKSKSLKIKSKPQKKPLGMHDALLNLESEIENKPCIIINAGDIVNDQLFIDLLKKIDQYYSNAVIVGKKVFDHVPAGYIKIEGDRVLDIIEKPKKGKEPSDLVNLVFHYFPEPRKFIKIIKKIKNSNSNKSDAIYELALNDFIKNNYVHWVAYNDYWQKLKHPHFVLDMTELFLKYKIKKFIHPLAKISDLARVNGDVFIEEGAVLHPGAVIQGPAYIGKNVTIGNNSLVRQSIIEENAVIGFSSEVARSYIGPRSMLHHNFIGDSVLECDVNPSWGTTTGNLRIDGKEIYLKRNGKEKLLTNRTKLGTIFGKGVFCGINCSIMPGVAIDAYSKIMPSTIVFNPEQTKKLN